MKTFVVVAIVLAFIAGASYHTMSVQAQSLGVTPSAATPLSGCPAPAAGFMNFCQVTNDAANPSGAYLTANGAPYFLLQKAGSGGNVTSVFTRTGNVVAAPGDYKYSDLANKPTTISCSTSNQGNTGFTASGCTIN